MAQTDTQRDASVDALFAEMERRIDPDRLDPDRDARIDALFAEMRRRIDVAPHQSQIERRSHVLSKTQ